MLVATHRLAYRSPVGRVGCPTLRSCRAAARRAAGVRTLAQVAQTQARRPTKKEGTIMEFFTNLTSEGPPFPPRFADLKKEICGDADAITQSWRSVLRELEGATREIEERGSEV
ncbi:hypothetical protein TRAPUB_2626 [Trametes pubescens]|uniref:Uncharacterized protein n=1 Tax=Trametes pubescens TaxID=154538 RepID=A0A1M2VG27_TRAPU|nr:hypothetical protein TRAPUB_2626 [Trametes pubescens]